MRIHEIIVEQELEEGPKTRAAALSAMMAAGGLGGLNYSNTHPTDVPTTQQTVQKKDQIADLIDKDTNDKPAHKFNTSATKEPKPFVPADHLDLLMKTARKMGINNNSDMASFLAQCNVETRNWAKSTEQFTYTTPDVLQRTYTSKFPTTSDAEDYIDQGQVAIANRALANKNGNGNEASGDGWRYRGRGFIHITGRELYAKAGEGVHPENPDIYLKHPELLSTNPTESAKAAAWYFLNKVGKGKTSSQASDKVNPAGLKKGERMDVTKQFKQKLAALSRSKKDL